MTNIFPEEVTAALDKMAKEKLKPVEFEGGLVLKFKSVDKVKSQYGATEDSTIVERGILEEGEQFVYIFEDENGLSRKLYSTSMPFLIAVKEAEISPDDWVKITRTGKTTETRYTVEKVAPIA